MLKIDLKEPCYTCKFSDIHFDDFSFAPTLYCNKMQVCKMVNELKINAQTEETISIKQDNDPVNHRIHYTQVVK